MTFLLALHAGKGMLPEEQSHSLAPTIDLSTLCPSSTCFNVSTVPPGPGSIFLNANGEKEASFFPTQEPSVGNCWFRLQFMTTWGWKRTTDAWQGPGGSTFDTELVLTKEQTKGTPAEHGGAACSTGDGNKSYDVRVWTATLPAINGSADDQMLNQQIVDWATCSNHPDYYKYKTLTQCNQEPMPPPPPAPPPPPPTVGMCHYTIGYRLQNSPEIKHSDSWEGKQGLKGASYEVINQSMAMDSPHIELQHAALACAFNKPDPGPGLRIWKVPNDAGTAELFVGGTSCTDDAPIGNISLIADCALTQ